MISKLFAETHERSRLDREDLERGPCLLAQLDGEVERLARAVGTIDGNQNRLHCDSSV